MLRTPAQRASEGAYKAAKGESVEANVDTDTDTDTEMVTKDNAAKFK